MKFHPMSPQVSNTSFNVPGFRSEQLHKSRNSAIDEDLSTTKQPECHLIIPVHEDLMGEQENHIQCMFCSSSMDLIRVCECSWVHEKCAAEHLRASSKCQKCNQIIQVETLISLELSAMRSAILQWTAIICVLGGLGVVSWLVATDLSYAIKVDRFLLAIVILTYVVGLICLMCFVHQLINKITRVEYKVKGFFIKPSSLLR